MLVYGDQKEVVAPARLLKSLAAEDGCFLSHDRLRSRFIALAGLAQAVADEDFQACGRDRHRPAEAALLASLVAHGASLMASFDAGCTGATAPSVAPVSGLPERATFKCPEGYAFYALYPEQYGLAARRLRLRGSPRLIGLRSIGTGLAAIAAAALGAPAPVTLRPVGDPFARTLRLHPSLEAGLLDAAAHFIIVDEGPGLSGSSLGCVADWLEDRGIEPARISFLPGHDGELGPQASERHRKRWEEVQRPVEQLQLLRRWVEELLGPVERWEDLSGGSWRALWSACEADWPAVTPMWERAKFLVRADGIPWLVRFAGLGAAGEEKLEFARTLYEAEFCPETAGLAHGWLIQRWHEEARPTRPTGEELLAYLGLRARLPAAQGASLSELVTMVRRNAPGLADWSPPVEDLAPRVRPVRIDGKLQPHEWLRLPSGRLLKADAHDHHRAHDLVGCQDLAWDVAGASIEFALDESELRALRQALGVDEALTAFYHVAYAAFRFGAHRMSEGMVDAAEADRHRRAAERYQLALVDSVKHLRDVHQPVGGRVEALS